MQVTQQYYSICKTRIITSRNLSRDPVLQPAGKMEMLYLSTQSSHISVVFRNSRCLDRWRPIPSANLFMFFLCYVLFALQHHSGSPESSLNTLCPFVGTPSRRRFNSFEFIINTNLQNDYCSNSQYKGLWLNQLRSIASASVVVL